MREQTNKQTKQTNKQTKQNKIKKRWWGLVYQKSFPKIFVCEEKAITTVELSDLVWCVHLKMHGLPGRLHSFGLTVGLSGLCGRICPKVFRSRTVGDQPRENDKSQYGKVEEKPY